MNSQETPKQFTAEMLRRFLPYGAQAEIARKLRLPPQAVNQAIAKMNMRHDAVHMAIKMVKESGALEAEMTLAEINQMFNPENKAA